MNLRFLATATALSLSALTNTANADTATIGISIAPSTLDPQLSLLTSDVGIYRHIYGSLVKVDSNNQVVLDLATSYKPLDDHTWEFKLREGVKFHDGSDFDAKDVVFTLERLGTVPGHDGLAAQYVAPITDIEVVDPYTILLKTEKVTPDVPKRLAQISIISNELSKDVASADFNSGVAAIGTGPFTYVEWKRGDQLVLDRNDGYWGDPSDFERVVLRTMTNPATRVAALEAGDIDMVDNIPPLDAQRLMEREDITVALGNSGRVHFIQFDTTSDVPPLTTAKDGSPLTTNPFADLRVRQALSMAISRDLIVERIMDGFAQAVSQGVPEGFSGYAPDIPMPVYDTDGAKALLTEAGYPEGFSVTLGCPNDRYVNDAALCQAIGQMWSRIGMDVTVDATPKSVYFKKLLAGDYPAHFLAWGNTSGDSISFLKSIAGTPDKENGRGSYNRSYTNPDLDNLIDKAASIVDEAERVALLREAMTDAINDQVFMPLHINNVIAATRKGLTYTPQVDENTNAMNLRKE